MKESELSVSKDVTRAARFYQRNFGRCLKQAEVRLGDPKQFRATVRLTFGLMLPNNKARFIPQDLSDFANSRFAEVPVEIDQIEAHRDYIFIKVIPAGLNPLEEHKKFIFLEKEEMSRYNFIWVDTMPRSTEPYKGMFTYDDNRFSPVDIVQKHTPLIGKPKPVDPRVISAIAQMLPDPTYKRNLFGWHSVATFPTVNKHLWQPEREVVVTL
ncbi:TPA: hypothetical protein DEQ89_03505 [Candidatus Daviesbacteria bacterium]|nr:hypothetical protein [Candidatus Daviesbacteria bacterium]